MYSKYDEMQTIHRIISTYISSQRKAYYSCFSEMLRSIENDFPDISEIGKQKELQRLIYSIDTYSNNNSKAVSILNTLKTAIDYKENKGDLEDENYFHDDDEVKGNKIFENLKNKNSTYKEIMSSVALELWKRQDTNLENLNLDLNSKIKDLKEKYKEEKISKYDLIYYINICEALIEVPEYIHYHNNLNNNHRKKVKTY